MVERLHREEITSWHQVTGLKWSGLQLYFSKNDNRSQISVLKKFSMAAPTSLGHWQPCRLSFNLGRPNREVFTHHFMVTYASLLTNLRISPRGQSPPWLWRLPSPSLVEELVLHSNRSKQEETSPVQKPCLWSPACTHCSNCDKGELA